MVNGLSEKTIIVVRIYNQQFQGTILLMVGLTSRVNYNGAIAVGSGFKENESDPNPFTTRAPD